MAGHFGKIQDLNGQYEKIGAAGRHGEAQGRVNRPPQQASTTQGGDQGKRRRHEEDKAGHRQHGQLQTQVVDRTWVEKRDCGHGREQAVLGMGATTGKKMKGGRGQHEGCAQQRGGESAQPQIHKRRRQSQENPQLLTRQQQQQPGENAARPQAAPKPRLATRARCKPDKARLWDSPALRTRSRNSVSSRNLSPKRRARTVAPPADSGTREPTCSSRLHRRETVRGPQRTGTSPRE